MPTRSVVLHAAGLPSIAKPSCVFWAPGFAAGACTAIRQFSSVELGVLSPSQRPSGGLAIFQASLIHGRLTLGMGSFGVLMLFRDRLTDESWAVKYVSLDGTLLLADWEREEPVWRAAAASADPGSDYFVRFVSSWEGGMSSKQTGAFIMEAPSCLELPDLRRRAPIAPPRLAALTWASQLMLGLLPFLHRLNLLLRDLEPNNAIPLGLEDAAVLEIPGMGAFLAHLMTFAVQTSPYRAPDMLRGATVIEARPGNLLDMSLLLK